MDPAPSGRTRFSTSASVDTRPGSETEAPAASPGEDRHDGHDLELSQLRRQRGQRLRRPPPMLDRHALPFRVAVLPQALTECVEHRRMGSRAGPREIADSSDGARLLRLGTEWRGKEGEDLDSAHPAEEAHPGPDDAPWRRAPASAGRSSSGRRATIRPSRRGHQRLTAVRGITRRRASHS